MNKRTSVALLLNGSDSSVCDTWANFVFPPADQEHVCAFLLRAQYLCDEGIPP